MDNFNYTNNHISIYKSDNLTLSIYRKCETISNLSLDLPKINYENCFTKVRNTYNIEEDLIIVTEDENINQGQHTINSISIYNPSNKEKILYNDICIDEQIIVEEDLSQKIENLDEFIYLTNQGIDLLNPASNFYTDLCFHYKSPIDGKDIPLKERFKLFFPNVSLCEKGCSTKGINVTTNSAICECTLNNIINNKFLGENKFAESVMAEFKTLIQDTNIEVLRCYKDLFSIEFYRTNHGSFIIFGLIFIQIILTIIYRYKYIFHMKKYLLNLFHNFITFISKKAKYSSNNISNNKLKEFIANPIKHKINNKNDKDNNKEIIKDSKKKIENKNKNKITKNNTKHIKLTENNINSNQSPKVYINSSINLMLKNNKVQNSEEDLNNIINKNIPSLMMPNPLKMNMEEYLKTDPDDMDYDNARKRDKRTFCVYFIDNIKSNLLIINIFYNFEVLNPWPIKFLLFILNVELYFFVNGLFFTEDYLKEMFYDNDINFYDFIARFLDRIYYIILIGIVIRYIIDFFFFEEKIIKKLFKREKDNILFLQYEMAKIIKKIKKNYLFFIIFCFFIAIFIWYYVFCFNNIYPSMKKEWIITGIITIFAMQILSFIKLFVGTLIRFIAIKCKSERLFKISQFLS